jgi:hypothetical protein
MGSSRGLSGRGGQVIGSFAFNFQHFDFDLTLTVCDADANL